MKSSGLYFSFLIGTLLIGCLNSELNNVKKNINNHILKEHLNRNIDLAFVDLKIDSVRLSINSDSVKLDAMESYSFYKKYYLDSNSAKRYPKESMEFKSMDSVEYIKQVLIPSKNDSHVGGFLFNVFKQNTFLKSNDIAQSCYSDKLKQEQIEKLKRKIELAHSRFDGVRLDSLLSENLKSKSIPLSVFATEVNQELKWLVVYAWGKDVGTLSRLGYEETVEKRETCRKLGHIRGRMYSSDFKNEEYFFTCM